MARSLGLDVGNRRIGVAVSDTLKVIARPVEVIDRRRQSAIKRIAVLLHEFAADEIIIGYPYNTNGSAGEQAQRVEQFAHTLRAQVNVLVRFCDERYSTGEALEILSARKGKEKVQPDDAIAAAVILQRYLDQNKTDPDESLPWASPGSADTSPGADNTGSLS
jgi:putative Holliday junction resolvase